MPGRPSKYLEHIGIIARLWKEGKTDDEIAEELPMSNAVAVSIRGFRVRHGMPNVNGLLKNKYDWDWWLNGKQHTITRGEHFTVTVKVMRLQISNMSNKRGGTAFTTADGDSITFQFAEG